MQSFLNTLDYFSDEYTEISLIHIDVVNTIASRFPLNLPLHPSSKVKSLRNKAKKAANLVSDSQLFHVFYLIPTASLAN